MFEAAPPEVTIPPLAGSDLLQQQAQLEGDLGEAARVALEAERQEAAEADAAAAAAAEKAEQDEVSEAVAAAAASLPVVPFEVVSKINADGATVASERKVGGAGGLAGGLRDEKLRQREHEEEKAFWDPRGQRQEEEEEEGDGGGNNDDDDGSLEGKVQNATEGGREDGEDGGVTVLFAREEDSASVEGGEDVQDGRSPDGGEPMQ